MVVERNVVVDIVFVRIFDGLVLSRAAEAAVRRVIFNVAMIGITAGVCVTVETVTRFILTSQ
jgi:hypothetical protein